MKQSCLTCDKDISKIENSVVFPCPECGKKIIRCGNCRKLAVDYKHECGFEGP